MDNAKSAEKDILREYQLGNLTPLGVANYLRRAGFSLSYATERSNALIASRRVAWLIERKNYDGSPFPHWYAEDATGWHGWVTDAAQAMSFATRSEADAAPAYRMIASDPNISLTEHVFIGDRS